MKVLKTHSKLMRAFKGRLEILSFCSFLFYFTVSMFPYKLEILHNTSQIPNIFDTKEFYILYLVITIKLLATKTTKPTPKLCLATKKYNEVFCICNTTLRL